MFTESAYSSYDNEEFQLNNTISYRHEDNPCFVHSCGHYRLLHRSSHETYRPNGLHDCQLLYLAQGTATFYIQGKECTVREGNVVVYYPQEPQHYIYRLRFEPEVYWIHFDYEEMKPALEELGIDGLHLFEIGTKHDCAFWMKRIIQELQFKNSYYQSVCYSYLLSMLALIARAKDMPKHDGKTDYDLLMEDAIQYFHHKYNEQVSISDFCRNYHTNEQHFRKSFKDYTGLSPKKFLLDIRMKKALEFIQDSSLNFTEIAAMVGYTDSLYFSRLFHQYTGKSPREYRKQLLGQ